MNQHFCEIIYCSLVDNICATFSSQFFLQIDGLARLNVLISLQFHKVKYGVVR